MLQVPEHIDALIALRLAGEASADEMQQLNEWLSADVQHQQYFDELSVIFQVSDNEPAEVDVNAAWTLVSGKMDTKRTEAKVRSMYPKWLQVASAAVVLLIAGTWFYIAGLPDRYIASNSTVFTDTLPDGSSVTLNRYSQVEYAESFNQERRVRVRGEAYFKVVHMDNKPFIIEAGRVLIKDIGTKFNVLASRDSEFVEVTVDEGVVMFYKKDSDGILLHAGESAKCDASGNISRIDKVIPNRTSYVTGKLEFNNSTLTEVGAALESVYGVHITVGTAVKNCALTADFSNENLDTILSVISMTLSVTISHEGDRITINGTGCR